jgi:HEAT repeat protein
MVSSLRTLVLSIAAAVGLAPTGLWAADASVAELQTALKSPDAMVRAHAVESLAEMGPAAQAAAADLAGLVKDPDAKVRRQVIRALVAIRPGVEIGAKAFVSLMEDQDPGVRLRAMSAIADAGPAAVPLLIESLKNEKVAYWACLVLRDMGPEAKDAVPALTETLSSKQPQVCREALLALAAIGQPAAAAVPRIAALVGDGLHGTAATYALGAIGTLPADIETKVRENAKGGDKLLSTASLWTLARVHPDDKEIRREVTERLVERLKEQDPNVRAWAARGLAALPPAPDIVVPIFEKAFADADEATLRSAMDAIAGIGARAVPPLVRILGKEKYAKLRGNVAYVLGEIGPEAAPATEALAKLLSDADAKVSTEAAMALAKIGAPAAAAVPELTKAVEKAMADAGDKGVDQQADTTGCAAAYALGRIGPAAAPAASALLKATASREAALSLAGAWALAQIEPASAEAAAKTVPILVTGLVHAVAKFRQGAAESLGNLGPLAKDALDPLQKAAKEDPDQAVRQAAAQAVEKISQPAAKTEPAPKTIAPGAIVVTLQDDVPLQRGTEALARLPKGTELKVLMLEGDWVGVRAVVGGQVKNGWVQKSQVGWP